LVSVCPPSVLTATMSLLVVAGGPAVPRTPYAT
jgi:hypothetical protein